MLKKKASHKNRIATAISRFFLTVRAIVLSPKDFFENMTDEGGWLEPFKFFLCCASVYAFMTSLTGFSLIHWLARLYPEIALDFNGMQALLLFFIHFQALLLLMIASSFVISLASMMALHFLGGNGSYESTYRVLSCCWVVLLVSWIPLIGLLAGLYFFVLVWHGLSKVHEIEGWKAIAGVLGGSTAVSLFSFVICLSITGMLGGFGQQRAIDAETERVPQSNYWPGPQN